ncbi:MAG TPA: ribosome maturation factor RimM [Anaerovoracaceae bacterium]|nr:ribosome maturation factor RimM [Anaerovoracaceae bacterium]
MEKLRLGKITGAVGIKGELKVYPYTDYKEKFEEIEYVLIDGLSFNIEKVRYVKNTAVLKLEGIDDRAKAEANRQKEIFVMRKDAPPLPDDTYYVKDLVGLKAVDEKGIPVGTLSEVIINNAQDLYMIKPEDGSAFPVPAVAEFIKEIDLENGTICVKLIEGLKEL